MIFTDLFRTKPSVSITDQKRAAIKRNLLRREAKIGGELFGPVPDGTRREFFCLDPHTWVWHEEWIDQKGQRKSRTTRYNVRPNAILKAQDDSGYHLVSIEEARHLLAAAEVYQKRTKQELYADVA